MTTTLELLRRLARIAGDPSAPAPERAAAAAELPRLLERHGFTEADLAERELDWRCFNPPPATEPERMLAIHLACVIRRESAIDCRSGTEALEVEATPGQWARIEILWTRHLPVFRRCWRTSAAPQEERMRREIERLRRELDDLPGHAVKAFIMGWDLPVGEAEDPADQWSDADPLPDWMLPVCALMRDMTAKPGEPAPAPDITAN